jgi:hypothetical protein
MLGPKGFAHGCLGGGARNRQPIPGANGFAVSRNLIPNLVSVESLTPLGRETRKHPSSQIRKLQASIEQFGFVLVVDVDGRVVGVWSLPPKSSA